MGCLGGFEVLGLVGLVIGPVVLTLLRELWQQSVRDLARRNVADPGVNNSAESVKGRCAQREATVP